MYRLVDHGYPYKKIMHGKKWVGRVVKCVRVDGDGAAPRYLGIIRGVGDVTAPTEREAFEEIAARAMGFDSAAALHAKNRETRALNRERSAKINAAVRGLDPDVARMVRRVLR